MDNYNILKTLVNNFLKTLPSYENKVFILKEENNNLQVIYDSWAVEGKTIYRNSKGNYINGRQGEGRMFLNDFKYDDGKKYESISLIDKVKKDKFEYLSQKEVIVGGVYKTSSYDTYLYMGKNIDNKNVYLHFYGSKGSLDNMARDLLGIYKPSFDILKTKKKFKEKIKQFKNYELISIYRYCKEKTGEIENFETIINQKCDSHDLEELRYDYMKVCKKCGKLLNRYGYENN